MFVRHYTYKIPTNELKSDNLPKLLIVTKVIHIRGALRKGLGAVSLCKGHIVRTFEELEARFSSKRIYMPPNWR